jgi:hypothetical protein
MKTICILGPDLMGGVDFPANTGGGVKHQEFV